MAPESVATADTATRCMEWLDGVHRPVDSEFGSQRTMSQHLDNKSDLSLATNATTTQATSECRGRGEVPATPLCLGVVVTIPKWSLVQNAPRPPHVVYHVACRKGNATWEVRKRYADFVALHGELQHQYRLALFLRTRSQGDGRSASGCFDVTEGRFSTEPLPSLPGRRFWPPTNADVEAVLRRCVSLQGYLQQLLRLPRPSHPDSPLAKFLAESAPGPMHVLSTSFIVADNSRGLRSPRGVEPATPGPRPLLDPSTAQICITYPEWVQHEEFWSHEYHTDHDKMQLVIDISRKNVCYASGGPFGAAIFNKRTGRLVSVGVSLVEYGNNCCLHAEMVAVQLATAVLKSHTLDRDPEVEHELFSSSEPCAMCIGATLWCGVQKLVCAATDVDVRSLLHDTGPVFEESFRYLQSKGITIKRKFLRTEAKQVLCEYSAISTSASGRQV